jgi:hypothetical protein
MNRSLVGVVATLLLSMSISCEKEKIPDPTPTGTPAASAAAATPAAAPVVAPTPLPEPENLPVAADFEDEAEKAITKANYKTELASIEAELKR